MRALHSIHFFALFCAFTTAHATITTSKVTWTSPSADTTYTSNDVINATWIAKKKIVSPSFKLCVHSAPSSHVASPSTISIRSSKSSNSSPDQWDQDTVDDSTNNIPSKASDASSEECGGSVWPTVRPGSTAGEYGISLAVPSLSTSDVFYLLMESDLGDTYKSPAFKLLSDADFQTGSNSGSADPIADNPGSGSNTPAGTGSGGPGSPAPTKGRSAIWPTATILQRPLPIGPLVPPISHTFPTNTPSPQVATASSGHTTNAVAAAIAVPLAIVAFAALAGLVVYLLYKRRTQRGADRLVHDGLTLAPSRSRASTLSSLNTMDKFSMVEKPQSIVSASQPQFQPSHLGYAPYTYAPSRGLSLAQPTQAHFMASHQNPLISPPIQGMRPVLLNIPSPPLDPARPNFSRTITPQYGATDTLSSAANARPPPSALRPALGIIPPFHDLTPPGLPTDDNIHHQTMQSILNSYMEIDPTHLNRSLPPVPAPPLINYATRPPLDLDRMSR